MIINIKDRSKYKKKNLKFFKPLDDSLWCMYTLIELKGQPLSTFLINTILTKKQIYSLIAQLCYIGNMMKAGDYLHDDLHSGNITIQKSSQPTIKYKNKKYTLPIDFQLSAIDYGEVKHKSTNKSKQFKERPDTEYYMDAFFMAWFIIIKQDKYIKDCKDKKKNMPWDRGKSMFNAPLTKFMAIDINLWNKIKHDTINKYPDSAQYIEYFEKNKNMDKFIKERKDRKKHYVAAWALIDMLEYFGIYYPKICAESFGWCSYHPAYLGKNELLQIYKYKNSSELMHHCLSKLKLL